MARIFTFKGKTMEELQAMKLEDVSKLFKSRQRRAVMRMSASYKEILKKVEKSRKGGGAKAIRTHTREAVILPGWVGLKFAVYDGKTFQELNIGPEMIGHRLGEFAYTIKHVVHSAPGIRATRGSKFLAVK
jgi:small subunit ribosomal protein S19